MAEYTSIHNGPTIDTAVTNSPTADQKAALAGVGGTPNAGNPYVTDSDPRLDVNFVLQFNRNAAAAGDEWLRVGAVPSNQTPVRIPFDATIVAISASTTDAETWDVEVYDGTVARVGGTPSDASKLAELVISAANSGHTTVSVNVSAGDELAIFARGTGLSRPVATLWLVRR